MSDQIRWGTQDFWKVRVENHESGNCIAVSKRCFQICPLSWKLSTLNRMQVLICVTRPHAGICLFLLHFWSIQVILLPWRQKLMTPTHVAVCSCIWERKSYAAGFSCHHCISSKGLIWLLEGAI